MVEALASNTRAVNEPKSRILEIVASNIIGIRKAQGLTQEQLAHKAGIDRSYMGYIENAKHNVSVSMLEKIAVALGSTVEELVRER